MSQNTDHIVKTISPDNNVYYFNNNIDVRICPKNAMSTIKNVAHLLNDDHHDNKTLPAMWRVQNVREKCDRITPPFRKGSKRYAIKRDPIERFLSEYRFLKLHHGVTMSIDETIDKLETGEHKYEPHYMSQSYFLGNPEIYDQVIDIKDTITLLDMLWKNRSTEAEMIPHDLVCNLQANMTHDQKQLGGFELTKDQESRVVELYKIDYKRGWHGN